MSLLDRVTCCALTFALALAAGSANGMVAVGRAWASNSAAATVPAVPSTYDTSVHDLAEESSQEATPAATVLTLIAPSICNAKQSVTVKASLATSEGVPIAGRAVSIGRVAGETRFVLGTASTDASGVVSVRVSPVYAVVVEARFAGDKEYLLSTSARHAIKPRALLGTPWTHDAIAYPGQRLPARGTLWPAHASGSSGTSIVCERYESGRWVRRATYSAKVATTKSGSRYRGAFKLPFAGTWRVRAKHADAGHAETIGPARTVVVKNWRKRYVGERLGGFRNHKKMVAITIDDGPNRRTMEICSILERCGAKGTFFFTRELLNNGNRWQARRAYDRGHEIANHTASHRMLMGSYSSSYRQAYLPMATIRSSTGFDPIWIRAMGGGIDRTGMRAVVKTGQLYCNWSVDSYDSHATYTPPSTLYRIVIRATDPGDVILIHQTHPETVKALPAICRELKRRGYKMVTLSELAASSSAR